MRDRVRLIASWFGLPPRQIIGLLTEAEVECLAVEAMLSRAVKVDVRRPTMLGYPAYVPDYASIDMVN